MLSRERKVTPEVSSPSLSLKLTGILHVQCHVSYAIHWWCPIYEYLKGDTEPTQVYDMSYSSIYTVGSNPGVNSYFQHDKSELQNMETKGFPPIPIFFDDRRLWISHET